MRIVFGNMKEVCQKWAEQSQFEGYAGNVSFRDSTIYSYGHWWMARFVRPGVVLVRNESYSISTSSHQYCVKAALYGKTVTTYHVPFQTDHVGNIMDYCQRVRHAADAFWNCREYAKIRRGQYLGLVGETERYAAEFLSGHKLPPLFGFELSGPKAIAKLARG